MYLIQEFDRLYRRKKRSLGVTGSTVRISLKPLTTKQLRVLTHVTCENETSSFTKVRLGISNRGEDYHLNELQTVAADELCVSTNDILLGDGDRFFADFIGTTTDDVLVLTAIGWERAL